MVGLSSFTSSLVKDVFANTSRLAVRTSSEIRNDLVARMSFLSQVIFYALPDFIKGFLERRFDSAIEKAESIHKAYDLAERVTKNGVTGKNDIDLGVMRVWNQVMPTPKSQIDPYALYQKIEEAGGTHLIDEVNHIVGESEQPVAPEYVRYHDVYDELIGAGCSDYGDASDTETVLGSRSLSRSQSAPNLRTSS